jgi:uncharacterized membrane protein YphA (DoxX/SURF4 family)
MLKVVTGGLTPFTLTVLRVVVGVTFLLTGLPRLQNTAGFITFVGSQGIPAPEILGWLPLVLEPVGGILLILGIGTRWLGLYFVLEMLITTIVVKAAHGTPFIVTGRPGVGFELDLLLLGGALVLMALGSGQLSLEHNVLKRKL